MDTKKEVLSLLDEVLSLGGAAARFDLDTPLLGALPDLDSMAVVGLINMLEEHFGFIVGDDAVASNAAVARPDGGFYIKPEIGYHNKDWNFALQYQKVFTGDEGEIGTQKYNAGSLGLGVSYNIPLGK